MLGDDSIGHGVRSKGRVENAKYPAIRVGYPGAAVLKINIKLIGI
jgi:hypothetical protein